MDSTKFYGGASSRPRHRFLASAKDVVEASNSDQLEIILLPPATGAQPIDSDEENDDGFLGEDYFPEETAGEVEIHGEESDDDDTQETSEENRWRRSERLSLSEVEPVVIPDKLMQLAELPMFDIFSLFSDDLLDLFVEQTNLYATRDKNVHNFKTDRIEMRKFLGMIVVSGYHHLPTENDYWSTADDLSAPLFPSIVS